MNIKQLILAISKVEEEIEAEYVRHHGKMLVLETSLNDLKALCQHWELVYYPDPSGNNASWSECTICGKEL
jgi:hypothetical protein